MNQCEFLTEAHGRCKLPAEHAEEHECEIAWQVHFYNPKKRGTWIAKFATEAEAVAFAKGKTVWGKPAKAELVKP